MFVLVLTCFSLLAVIHDGFIRPATTLLKLRVEEHVTSHGVRPTITSQLRPRIIEAPDSGGT